MMKKIILLGLFTFFQAVSQSSLLVNDIQVDGLRRITTATFFNYLPVSIGEQVTEEEFPEIIRTLYQTNFFETVDLYYDAGVLTVSVTERPIIESIQLSGNKDLKEKDLLKALRDMGLGEGDAYNPMLLVEAEKTLLELYYTRSKYDVILDLDTTSISEGQVNLNVNIQEGITATIKEINIVGNKAFSEKEILKNINLSTTTWYSFLAKNDQFSADKMRTDLGTIEKFYFDRGFLDFYIDSTQVSLTSDKKSVYLTVNIHEGLPYRVNNYQFIGNDAVSDDKLKARLDLEDGSYYNRSEIQQAVSSIKEAYGELGYAFADVQTIPTVNNQDNTLDLTFSIAKGKRVYVRRIMFNGNTITNDDVLRREMRQMESAVYDVQKLKRSETRLARLSYLTNVRRREVPIPGIDNQVDIIFEVVENPTRSFSFGLGYGSSVGLLLSASYQTSNLFGSGYYLDIDLSASDYAKDYKITFTDPYLTTNGTSISYNFFYNEIDESKIDLADWASNNYGFILQFGIPISEFRSIYLGGGYRHTEITTGPDAPIEIVDELARNGDSYDEFVLDLRLTHDTRDKTVLATSGGLTRLSLEATVPGSDATYYKASIRNREYFSITEDFILSTRFDLSYGDGYGDTEALPFYRRYYAGGLTTIRGFKYNSLGPRYANGQEAGGDLRVTGGVELIFPWSLGADSENIRVAAFTDFGNVYSSFDDFSADEFRYSSGIYILWNSPVGPLNFSYAIPLNKKDYDETESFQFTIGVPF